MKKIVFALIFLAIAGISFLAGGWYNKDHSSSPGAKTERTVLYYVDPMNPGFRTDKPGVAPCGMPLEPVYADAGAGQDNSAMPMASLSPGAVKITPGRQQLIGAKVAVLQKQPMTYTLRLYGKVVSDETRIYRINASTDSWIRELSDVTTGSIVKKGQILAEALAPAYYNAQVTYLVALDNMDRIKQQLGGQLRHQQADLADNQIRLAVQALQNLGITDAQAEELANTRQAQPYLQLRAPATGVVLTRNITLNQWFKAGEQLFGIADIRRVWVYADVYENEAHYLRHGMTVKVRHAQMGKTFDAKVSKVLPLFDPVSKTLKVRLDVDNPRYDLRPDMFVDVEIPITLPPSLHVPADAVIDSGTRTILYVDMGSGVFEPRRVETGWRLGRQIEITGGLMPGEKVVVSGNFLIDSESRMKTAAAGTQGEMSKDPVCGMFIDEEKAAVSGRTIKHAGKTYYFCSEKCMQSFGKGPEKYAGKEPPAKKEHDHAGMQGIDHGRKGAHEPLKAGKGMEHGDMKPGKGSEDTPGKSGSTRGVIDWKRGQEDKHPTGEEEWSSGWGKFPGAEYLGLKQRKSYKSGPKPDMPEAGSGNTAEEAEDSPQDSRDAEMNHEKEGSRPPEPGPPAK